jgi:hypothetical protein
MEYKQCAANRYTIGRYSMAEIDDYILDVLMRDLVGHDRRPAGFLVYLWLFFEQQRSGGAVRISYVDLAENVGISKSSAQGAIAWLLSRKLISVNRESVTATPRYSVHRSWRRPSKGKE